MAESGKNKNCGKKHGLPGGNKNSSRGKNSLPGSEQDAGSGASNFRGADFAVEGKRHSFAQADKNKDGAAQAPARQGETAGSAAGNLTPLSGGDGGAFAAAQTLSPSRGDGNTNSAAAQASAQAGKTADSAAQTLSPGNDDRGKSSAATQTLSPLPGKAAGGAYTLAVFLMMLVSFLLALTATVISGDDQQAYQNVVSKNAFRLLSYALPQAAFCLTVYVVLRFAKIKAGQAFPCQKTPVYLWAAAILLAFGLLFGLGNVNELFLSFLQKFGYEVPQNTLPAMRNAGEYLLTVFCVAVLPAVMEEALFRGVVLGGLRGKSTLFAVLTSGLYFSLFHQNPAQTPYQFLAGAAFAFAAIASGNIFITVAAHFCNNLYILSAEFFGFSVSAHWGWTVSGLLALVISLGLFFLAGKKRGAFRPAENPSEAETSSATGKNSAKKTSSAFAAKQETRPKIKEFFVYSLPGVIASVIAWVLVLVS